jgi:SAM-dependent methyltransferase
MTEGDARQYAPAAERNREPILAVLQEVLPAQGRVLEVASGTGQHAVFFARALPGLHWQPTDPDPEALRSIEAWRRAEALPNVLAPVPLDVLQEPWPAPLQGPPQGSWDALVCINMVHISPWEATQALLRGAARVLAPGGRLALYGPYLVEGRETAPSNLVFDASLRSRNPAWGVRALEAVLAEGTQHGLVRERVVDMPSNNLTVVLERAR